MKVVHVGIIGIGFMGSTHFKIYENLPGVKVVAIADCDEAKRKGDIRKVVGNIGGSDNTVPLDYKGMHVYKDGMDLIADPDVDIVDICVPTPFHCAYMLAAFKAGKHLFSEKPLCRNIEELKSLRVAAAEAKGYFNVGMCIRAWPEYRHAWEMLQSGKLGKAKNASFRRLSPNVSGNGWNDWYMKESYSGGALLDMHLHDTDAVCYFFGNPKSVSSFGIKGETSDCAVDHIVTNYDFGDPSLFVTAEGGWCAAVNVPFEMSFQIICEKGTIKLDATGGYHIYWNDGKVEDPKVADAELPTGWHQELKYFTDCVRDGIVPDKYQKPEEIFKSYAVVMAEIESVNQDKRIGVQYV
ncbi:MAG: Gfo/Idh/MocA family oxidoreductase [Lentisphaeria bacterium]